MLLHSRTYLEVNGYDYFVPSDKIKRGVILYTKANLCATHNFNALVEFEEAVFCRLQLNSSKTMLVECYYRSPTCGVDNNKGLCQLMNKDLRQTFVVYFYLVTLITRRDWNNNKLDTEDYHPAMEFFNCI